MILKGSLIMAKKKKTAKKKVAKRKVKKKLKLKVKKKLKRKVKKKLKLKVKKKLKRKIKKEEIFDSLVINAIDFLKVSVAELKERPKYSVINFCSSIELFLKARLLKEHWSLIVSKPENADIFSFQAGDFKSVTIKEAIKRLNNIANQRLTPKEKECFDQIRQQRNKLVHFFDKKYSGKQYTRTIDKIMIEQYKGWFYLHELLVHKWKDEFSHYAKEIRNLNRLMHSHREFLKTKFDFLKPKIERKKKSGMTFNECLACYFESAQEEEICSPLFYNDCLVCNTNQWFLKVPCPNNDCYSEIFVFDSGECDCEVCGEHISIEYLLGMYGGHVSPDEVGIVPDVAVCQECEYYPGSVVPLDNEDWLCLNCLLTFHQVEQCEWCGEWIVGAGENTYLVGCSNCSGRLGWKDGE